LGVQNKALISLVPGTQDCSTQLGRTSPIFSPQFWQIRSANHWHFHFTRICIDVDRLLEKALVASRPQRANAEIAYVS
jgi:hypothetical protein